VTQLVEYLLCKYEAQSLNFSPTKKKKKKKNLDLRYMENYQMREPLILVDVERIHGKMKGMKIKNSNSLVRR
jgi:hypothetical protein